MNKEAFSFDTITNFDSHILASVPNYDVLFNSLLILSDYFIMQDKTVYDIGCSTGKLLKALDKKNENINCKYIGLDISTNLLPKEVDSVKQHYLVEDLNKALFQFKDACLVFSIFTLQFLNKEARQTILTNIYNGLQKGGALIITEKVYCDNGQMQDIFTSSYYDYKKQSFSEKEILDKEVSLRKILKPLTRTDNLDMLQKAGFTNVEMFFKYLNFEGFLCVK